jgi:uncharacterized phage protein gp47/JayE
MPQLVVKSERQIQIDILTKIIALLGINDINPASVLDIVTASVAQQAFQQYVAMVQIARLVDLDAISGQDLDNKAFEYGLTRQQPEPSTGVIDILRPAGFVMVSTSFYPGLPAPIIGNTTIYVNDASSPLIGTSGTLILGYGTSNQEEVTYSSAPINNTNYWTYTVSPLAFNHAVSETVILAQGSNEVIQAGTVVSVPATGTTAQINFTTDNDVTLYSGQAEVTNVPVTCSVAGSQGNIPIQAISGTAAFQTPPFPGAQAINPVKFTTGLDQETDDELRDEIRDWIQSLSRGVVAAIQNAIVGLVDPVTAKRVVSANIILPQSTAEPVLVYIDDGTGFEPSFSEQGYEDILDNSVGAETRFVLDNSPLVKAQVQSNAAQPFNMSGGTSTLTYNIGIQTETITFQLSDFEFPSAATAYEVVAAINERATLIEARTSQGGTQIVITAVADTNEDIQVTGGTANPILLFPTDLVSTLLFYVDDVLLSKDGQTALINSGNLSPYNFSAIGASPWLLTIIVDGKTANPQTVTFSSGDFANPAAATVAEVVAVINAQLAGATALAINSNTQVRIASNTLLSASSQINITGGSANNAIYGLNFSTTNVVGTNGDYTLNRELGTIQLNTPLLANQNVSAGSLYTRAKLRATLPENYSITNGQTLVIAVDGGSPQTITFDNTFSAGQSAVATAAFINNQLLGATAIVRMAGGLNYVEINTNTYSQNIGSLEISSASTANGAFGFPLNTLEVNQRPNQAFVVSENAGPYAFAQNDSLVVILDNNIVNNTFSINFSYPSAVTSMNSTTQFSASGLGNVFLDNGELDNFFVAFTSGANTLQGNITSVSHVSGNTWQYNFTTLPTNLSQYAIGDLVNFANFSNAANGGYYVITGISTAGNGYVQVTNLQGVVSLSESSATAVLSQKRQISAYTAIPGQITVGTAFSYVPAVSDPLIVIPSTIENLVDYIGNIRITAFTLSGAVEGVDNNTLLQLSSQSLGSDGYIQASGGAANLQLVFPTTIVQGIQAYSYYTGLLAIVHKTIYGDDTDLVSYPGVGAAGITFYELAPTVREVEVNVTLVLAQGVTLSSIENSVASAISGYINNLGVGDEVVIEQIRAAVIAVPGVTDVVLNIPTANIPIADNELPRTNNSLITVG